MKKKPELNDRVKMKWPVKPVKFDDIGVVTEIQEHQVYPYYVKFDCYTVALPFKSSELTVIDE